MDSIAKTSLLTAWMRAAESKRSETEGRLVFDPYAELLAGTEGAELAAQGIAAAGDQPAIAVRTAFIDEKLNAAVKRGVRQIAILAAGMDTRAYRLSSLEGCRVFELDRPEVFQYKQTKLCEVKPICDRQTVAVDLRDDWENQLFNAGFSRTDPTVWLVEGLIMYLEPANVTTLFERISAVALRGDVMLFDVLSRALLDAPFMSKQLQFLESIGAPWRFGTTEEPDAFMRDFGWNAVATQPGDFAPKRWPFPPAPRSVPNVPRSFFVEAFKL